MVGCCPGFPTDYLRPADRQSPAIRNDNLQFSVVPHCKKDSRRTFKHIWFLLSHKPKLKNQKSLNFCQRTDKKDKFVK